MLCRYQQRLNPAVLQNNVGGPHHIIELHAGIHQPPVVNPSENLRIDLLPARIALRQPHLPRALIDDGIAEVSTESAHTIPAADDGGNQCVGAHAAGAAGLFKQDHRFPQPGGGKAGGDSGRTAAGNNNIRTIKNWNIKRIKHNPTS